MISTPEDRAYADKAALEAFVTLANTAYISAPRLAAVNLNAPVKAVGAADKAKKAA